MTKINYATYPRESIEHELDKKLKGKTRGKCSHLS